MTHGEGASDTLVAIQGRLDRMDIRFKCMETRFDVMYQTLDWHSAMLKAHGHQFGTIEGLLRSHDRRLDEIDATLKEHDRRFDQVDIALQEHDRRFDQVDIALQEHDRRFDQVDTALVEQGSLLRQILARLDAPRP
jgi:hypothetical protein